MTTYKDDPRWITAKWSGTCAKTKAPFAKGDRILYFPRTRTAYAGEAAEQAAREFEAAAQDEEFYNAGR